MNATSPLLQSWQRYPIKVGIVDDDENDLLIMRLDLEKSGEFVCTGTYRSGNEALAEIPKVRPNAVLMDIRMPDMDGRECARRLKIIVPHLKVIYVTGLLDIETMNKSLQAGAHGYLTKPVSAAECLACLKLNVRDAILFTENVTAISGRKTDRAKTCLLLTVRENQVMTLLSKGLLSKEIPDQLGISFSAVHKHQLNSYRKLRAHNRTEALNKW